MLPAMAGEGRFANSIGTTRAPRVVRLPHHSAEMKTGKRCTAWAAAKGLAASVEGVDGFIQGAVGPSILQGHFCLHGARKGKGKGQEQLVRVLTHNAVALPAWWYWCISGQIHGCTKMPIKGS